MWNLPNLLTFSRILMIPILVILFYMPVTWGHQMAAALFLLASITDWLDGYLARRLSLESPLGAFLDPVADKLIVSTALVLLVSRHPSIPMAISAAIIIGREITISALREWMAELGARSKVAVSWIGKFKTSAQMGAITLLLYQQSIFNLPTYELGLILLYIAVFLTLWSMFAYLYAAWPSLQKKSH